MAQPSNKSIPAPKGTRDLYPDDLLRQRYITEAWRRVSIRHGFDEIAGPTFEMLDLYKKKSGEGIVSELFSFRRSGGDDDYALRPEFTPTLARMYAAKANSLPSPCKWFTAGPYFRAEKPQRGRLREFLQWNCDVISADPEGNFQGALDSDTITPTIDAMIEFGLSPKDVRVKLSSRITIQRSMVRNGIPAEQIQQVCRVLDERPKQSRDWYLEQARKLGWPPEFANQFDPGTPLTVRLDDTVDSLHSRCPHFSRDELGHLLELQAESLQKIGSLQSQLKLRQLEGWCEMDSMVVRGLAYYTGTVFELIADGERAVAGGGRYDNLIELFGGPPTPAVGFGMGDVVLGLLLEDKGLMPEGPELMDALSQKPASLRPEAFVIANEAGEAQVEPLLARLRRGVESEAWNTRDGKKPWDADRYEVQPMHARRSYKSTKNIGKLLADARKQHAKFAVIIDSDEAAKVENLDTREDLGTFPLDQVGAKIAERL